MSWWWLVVAFYVGWWFGMGAAATANDDEWAKISRRRHAFVARGRELAWEQARRKAARRGRRP